MATYSKPLILTRDQSRRVDRLAVEQFGMHSLVLMENAGRAATDVLTKRGCERALILCGPGNNGGDGFVIARHLHLRGIAVAVLATADNLEALSPDAKSNAAILSKSSVAIQWSVDASKLSVWRSWLSETDQQPWIVDALLGTGARPPLRPPFRQLVQLINDWPSKRIAIDIPSGLDCDQRDSNHGSHDGAGTRSEIFRADVTVTMVGLKPAMLSSLGKAYCGEIVVVDIGVTPEVVALALDEASIMH